MVEETADIKKITCTLYGMRRHYDNNEVRLALFQQKYATKPTTGQNKRDQPEQHATLQICTV